MVVASPSVSHKAALTHLVRVVEATHGGHCQCPYAVQVTALQLADADLQGVRNVMPKRGRKTLLDVAGYGNHFSTDLVERLRVALMGLAGTKCKTGKLDEPDPAATPWREKPRIGVFADEDRWRNEITADEWARLYDVWSGSRDGAPLFNDEYRRAQGAYAAKAWIWKTPIEQEEPLDLAAWGYDEIIRALWLLRSTEGYPWEARVDQIGRIAASARQPFSEARRFIRYVDECDRGLIAIDPVVERVLQSFSQGDAKKLGARVRMQDQHSASEQDLDEAEEFHEPDGEHEGSREAEEESAAPAQDDGLPNPLAELRKLLPGGRGVLGKSPIVHSRTELDTVLLPRLLEGEPTLVILSGNAGDGKTAFIEDVLEAARVKEPERPGQPKVAVPNELEATLNGRNYLVVLDGSEDTYSKTNSALLDDALSAFKGDEPVSPDRGTLIAVNKGRLLSFLEENQGQYAYLWNLACRRYASGEPTGDDGYLLIDLNDRTVVGPTLDESLWGAILDKLLAWDGWTGCDNCPAAGGCPALFNAKALRNRRVRERLWEVFTLIDLDDRLHVTARHVVTRLASVLTGGLRCADVRATIAVGGSFPERAYFYAGAFLGRSDETSVEEAALNEIAAAYDPAETAEPIRDRGLGEAIASGTVRVVVPVAEGEPDGDLREIEKAAAELAGRTIDAPTGEYLLEYREAHLALMARLLRRRYFMGGADDVTPVRTLADFQRVALDSDGEELVKRLVGSLNASLGITKAGGDLVVPKDYARGLAGSGFAVKVPSGNFRVRPGTGLGTSFNPSRYTRSWPRSVLLEAVDGDQPVASLSIPLLMLEILGRADRGFRPTSRTERNYLVRVSTFYRLLAEHHWSLPLDYVLYERGRVRAGVKFAGADVQFWGV